MWSSLTGGCGGGGAGGGGQAPCARGKHAAALLDGHVYVLGGRGGGGALPLRDFWRYSLETGRWERLAGGGAAPPALQEHSLCAHAQRLYVFGGEAGGGGEVPLWLYDTQTGVWRKPTTAAGAAPTGRRGTRGGPPPPPGPRPRRGHSAHALNDCLLVYGGYMDLKGTTNEMWAFHYESETWQQVRGSGTAPARHRHAAALLGTRLLVHGGRCDLRACADLWLYDTMSRTWAALRPRGPVPAARCGHAGLRAGAHFYIFGGELNGQPCDELWRFHFATETWERLHSSPGWPSARVDCAALLLGAGGAGRTPAPSPAPPAPAPAPATGLLRGLSRLSALQLRRGAGTGGRARGAYSALARDSTESLARSELPKSRSAYAMEARLPADGGESPRAGDEAERRGELAREPVSVPDFTDALLAAAAAAAAPSSPDTKLVFLDSDSDSEVRRSAARTMGHSASVRFSAEQTSEYESEGRLSLGFCNPHYLCGEARALQARLTPDSGIELQELRPPAPAPPSLHLLVVGGREPARPTLPARSLALWLYRLL